MRLLNKFSGAKVTDNRDVLEGPRSVVSKPESSCREIRSFLPSRSPKDAKKQISPESWRTGTTLAPSHLPIQTSNHFCRMVRSPLTTSEILGAGSGRSEAIFIYSGITFLTATTVAIVPVEFTRVLDRRPSDLPVREMPNATLICNNFLMCGRYRLSRRKQVVEEYFDTAPVEHDWNPRYNIAPTQNVPIIRQNPKEPVREMSFVRWGLIPSWAKDSSVAAKMINARSETASMKPAFRDALKCRRCLIPADAFYEWKRIGKSKQPYCFEVNEGELFAFAGIWDRWKNASGNAVETCSILTTTPNAVTAVVHDRMPVILDPDSYDLWLDPGMKDVGLVSELLKPCNAKIMRSYPVSTRVNQVINDDEECSAHVQPVQTQNQLLF